MKNKFVKRVLILLASGIVVAGSIIAFLWFRPHRNVEDSKAFATISAVQLVKEFSANKKASDNKYLSADGNSKILILEGRVDTVMTNQKKEAVVLLKEPGAKMGVSCTFTIANSAAALKLQKNAMVKIKGAIAMGNGYDADLDLYDNAVFIECSIVRE